MTSWREKKFLLAPFLKSNDQWCSSYASLSTSPSEPRSTSLTGYDELVSEKKFVAFADSGSVAAVCLIKVMD